MPNKRVVAASAAVTAMLASTLAACGSDSETASPDGGLKGEPIKVMSILATGTTGQNYDSNLASTRASVRAVNARGGIDGRPLELVYCNEQNDAAAAEQCARDAVKKKVVAVVGYSSPRGAAAIHAILDPASIPVLAGGPVTETDFTSPLAYNVDGGVVSAFPACGTALADAGSKVQGIVRTDVDSAASLEPLIGAGIAGAGAKNSGVIIKVPANAADFSGFVRTLDDAGVTGVTSAIAEPLLVQLLQTANQLGVDLKVCTSQDAIKPNTLKDLGEAAGNLYTAGLPPAVKDSPAPGVDTYFKELKAETDAGGKNAGADEISANDLRGWEGPRMIERVASTIKGDVTGETLVAALNQQTAYDADMFGTIDFTKPGALQPSLRNYSAYLAKWSVKDGNYVLTQDDPVNSLALLGSK
jgi:branched-chain amino acid transport system substrate-binding protein